MRSAELTGERGGLTLRSMCSGESSSILCMCRAKRPFLYKKVRSTPASCSTSTVACQMIVRRSGRSSASAALEGSAGRVSEESGVRVMASDDDVHPWATGADFLLRMSVRRVAA